MATNSTNQAPLPPSSNDRPAPLSVKLKRRKNAATNREDEPSSSKRTIQRFDICSPEADVGENVSIILTKGVSGWPKGVYTIDVDKGELITETSSGASSRFETVFEVSRKEHNGQDITIKTKDNMGQNVTQRRPTVSESYWVAGFKSMRNELKDKTKMLQEQMIQMQGEMQRLKAGFTKTLKEIYEVLDNFLQCPVCMHRIEKSDTVPLLCGHIICGGCFHGINDSAGNHVRKCPTCRYPMPTDYCLDFLGDNLTPFAWVEDIYLQVGSELKYAPAATLPASDRYVRRERRTEGEGEQSESDGEDEQDEQPQGNVEDPVSSDEDEQDQEQEQEQGLDGEDPVILDY